VVETEKRSHFPEPEIQREDVLPEPFPRRPEYFKRIGSRMLPVGDKIYRRPVRLGGRLKWVPAVPLNPQLFKARPDWWKRHKKEFLDRYEQAWNFDATFWDMPDVYRDSWYARILKDNSLRRAVTRDGTTRVVRSIHQLVTGMSEKHEGGNVVMASKGWKRVGKSFQAKIRAKIYIAVMNMEFGLDGKIHQVYSIPALKKLLKRCQEGDFVICDESNRLTSTGAVTAIINLTNMLEVTGVARVGVEFIGPNFDFKQVGGALDIGFEHFGSNFNYELSRAVVYDPRGEPMYTAAFQRNFLWSEFPSYQEDKWKKVQATLMDEGSEEAIDPEELQADVAKLLEYAKEEYKYSLQKRRLPTVRALEGDAKVMNIRGPGTYIQIVASKVRSLLDNYACRLEDEEDSSKSSAYSTAPPTQEEEAAQEHPLIAHLITAAKAVFSQPQLNVSDLAAERFCRYYFQAMNQPDIAEQEANDHPEKHRSSSNAIGKSIRAARRKLANKDVGDIGELAIQSFLASRLPQTPLTRPARCQCLDVEDNDMDIGVGDVEGHRFMAVNVKLFLSERDGSVVHSSPEYRHDPHCTVVMEAVGGEAVRVAVMLDPEEVETLAQAREAGRLVTLEELVRVLQFGAVGS
jgi:hypothetical protein